MHGTLAMAKRTVDAAKSDVTGLYLEEPHSAKLANVIVMVLAISVSVTFFSTSPIIALRLWLNQLIFGYSAAIPCGEELA